MMNNTLNKPTFLEKWQGEFLAQLNSVIDNTVETHSKTYIAVWQPTVEEVALYLKGTRNLRAKTVEIHQALLTLQNWANGTVAVGYFPDQTERRNVLDIACKIDRQLGSLEVLYRDMWLHTPVLRNTEEMTDNIKLSIQQINKFIRHMQ